MSSQEIEELLKRIEEQRLRAEQAEGRAEQAEGRAELAERLTRPTTLSEYLCGCHDGLYKAFKVQQDKSLTTKGTVTNPEGKICPTYLRPWTDFVEQQHETFCQLALTEEDSRDSPRAFASLQHLEELGRDHALRKIASEKDLEIFERATLENPVAYIFQHLYSRPETRATFNLSSEIEFENHPNTLSESAEEVTERRPSTPIHSSSPSTALRADQICVYTTMDKRRIPVLIVEYKAPHKLTLPHLRLGLRGMSLKEEVVDRYTQPDQTDASASFQYRSDRLAAAAVTQVYSYMLENGLKYSYITTGEAFFFLQVRSSEPDTVYYHLADPTAEVEEFAGQSEEYLSRTAVGQVLAFCLMALRSEPRSQTWRKKAMANRSRWVVDDAAILHEIPETVRKQEPPASAFIPRTYRTALRSPIVTRSKINQKLHGCEGDQDERQRLDETPTDSDEEDYTTTPTQRRGKQRQPLLRSAMQKNRGQFSQHRGQTRSYCTQLCLRGLVDGSSLHTGCPNVALHRKNRRDCRHQLNQASFCSLLREQLESNLDSNCQPLGVQGSRGALFKVTLSQFGYTIAAKGTVDAFVQDLKHEAAIYKKLTPLQGRIIPVVLGSVDLVYPYYYDVGVRIVHMILLGWAGSCLEIGDEHQALWSDLIQRSVDAIHGVGVLHGDLRAPNMLWNEETCSVMLIDFERAKVWDESLLPGIPLSPVSPNKRKRASDPKENLIKSSLSSFSLALEVSLMQKR